MQLKYANYPALENAFVEFMSPSRRPPQQRVLVVCASQRLGARLRRQLAEKYQAVGNIRFMSFNGLLKELDSQNPAPQKKLLPNDDLHDFIIREIISRPGLNRYAPGRGFVSALKNSLRDLADSLAEPDVLKEQLASSADPRLEEDLPHLNWLVDVYRAYLQATAGVPGYRSYAQFFASALDQAENSAYLASFTHIIFYGFYDMTGRQLELFSRIAAHYPVTVFAPYERVPAFNFARKFFESNYAPASQVEECPPVSGALGEAQHALFEAGQSAPCPALHMAQAPGARGELFYTAKQILKLVEEDGFDFADIAVVARSAAPYRQAAISVFAENTIPLNAAFEMPLGTTALGVFCLNLLSLAQGGFARETILAVVTSPYFKHKEGRWRKLINASLASRDYAQWTDLITPQTKYYDADFLTWLENCKTRLETLNNPLPWADLCALTEAYLRENTDELSLTQAEASLFNQVLQTVEGFKRRSGVRPQAKEGEFVPDMVAVLSQTQVNSGVTHPGGVTFTDVMSLRGLSFKAVFLLGVNEKTFPLIVPEDPILKDYYRFILRDGLGYWINQTRERLEEEKLLFYTTLTSARQRVYVTWQRTDSQGKAAVLSVYAAELARACEIDLQSGRVEAVSGRILERLEHTGDVYLTPQEMAVYIALSSAKDKEVPFEEAGLLTPALSRAVLACAHTAAPGQLTPYDGKVQSGAEIFARLNAKGFSASALTTLAACPMKYFFSRALGLGEPDEALSRQELAPNLRGSAYHEVLAAFYEGLLKDGSLRNLFADGLRARLQQTLNSLYPREAYKRFGIYPVIWDLILQDVQATLEEFVLADTAELGNFIPSYFERELEGTYKPAPSVSLHLKGILDRIDLDPRQKLYRVDDYKSSRKAGKSLAQDILKKRIFQPFLYLLLARQWDALQEYQSAGSCLMSINKGYTRKDFTPPEFDALKPAADAFFARLARLVQEGDFYLSPTPDCQYCPYGAACRKNAFKMRQRALRCTCAHELEETIPA